jgi:hypothetical protein
MARTDIGAPATTAPSARKSSGSSPKKGRLVLLGAALAIAAAVAVWVNFGGSGGPRVSTSIEQKADEISKTIQDAAAKQPPPPEPATPQVQRRNGGPVTPK